MDRRSVLIGAGAAGAAWPAAAKPLRKSSVSLAALMQQIKHDVGSYILRHERDPTIEAPPGSDSSAQERADYQESVRRGAVRPPARGQVCSGQIQFAIGRVNLQVEVTNSRNGSGGLELALPFGPGIGLGGKFARARTDTVSLSLTIFPGSIEGGTTVPPPPSPPGFEGTPISDVLEGMLKDLVSSSHYPPCFGFGQDKQDNTLSWGFKVADTLDGKISLKLFALEAGGERASSVANKISVQIIGAGDGMG